ncbi:uncharacterized protein [Eucyclogobius newberryi]|uniref:uncharacterized protein n=1 Tax=Eucyclogobius newberryi TaxID=166745 RepID=UPI003B59549F
MTDVTEQDNEAVLSITGGYFRSISLRVRNCRNPVKKQYGSSIYWKIPDGAEYLEFVKYNGSRIPDPVESSVLWNLTDPSKPRRGEIRGSDYMIHVITQQDSGYYRFRGSNHQLLKWETIVIEHFVESYDFDEGNIKLEFPVILTPSQVKVKCVGNLRPRTVSLSDEPRFKITDSHFAIESATPEDAGKYEFFDKEDNLMLSATVEIREVEQTWKSYVILGAISFGGMLCCCCVKKCCCNKSSDKTDETEDGAAASTVNNHNPTQSTQTVIPLLPREPRLIIPHPLTYDAAEGLMDLPPPYEECVTQPSAPSVPAYSKQPENPPVHVEPTASPPETPQTNDVRLNDVGPSPLEQVSTSGTTGPIFFSSNNFNFTTSDSEPTFELSGTTFPSAPPLSSEDYSSIEYNSDKLNL